MILSTQICPIGQFGKPHGVNGEINLAVNEPIDITGLSCIIVEMDGINVPFFFKSVRPRGAESYLVMIDGFDTDDQVSALVNRTVYALIDQVGDIEEDDEGDGFYASDLIGYQITTDDNSLTGEIVDVDDSTDNVLFVVRSNTGHQVLIPVADEFIVDIDVDNRTLHLSLPDGLISI